ncbi:uncharacterized protein YbcI [Anaerosolibacter carboniphilus]|uniref:Uncharacterized protein YbcI n=1 Tax=Anaerosolibacter carboniphilus TaxID=1417629 RepID=A0A841KY60_9FIRM|nr:DUF3908 family protein [Anaerosolibacter carboniphilus]MBB6215065.1 uncharacterized protein YbcI [Anaerosolibacter carboniphilus]
MDINFGQLKEYSSRAFYSSDNPQARVLSFIINEIEKIFDASDIVFAYPKNLFINNKQVELFLIDSKKQLIKAIYEDKNLTISVYFAKDIINFYNKVNHEDDSRSLIIKFASSETIEFNSRNDTNTHHIQRFDALILEMCKFMMK